mgnify:CR=1 FL=1
MVIYIRAPQAYKCVGPLFFARNIFPKNHEKVQGKKNIFQKKKKKKKNRKYFFFYLEIFWFLENICQKLMELSSCQRKSAKISENFRNIKFSKFFSRSQLCGGPRFFCVHVVYGRRLTHPKTYNLTKNWVRILFSCGFPLKCTVSF